MTLCRPIVLTLFFLLTAPLVAAQSKDPVQTAIQNVHAQRTSALVSIRARLKVSMAERTQELTNEILGTVVHSKGLVIASAEALSAPEEQPFGSKITIEPVEILIFQSGQSTGVAAKIVHIDRSLGLAFLQMKAKSKPGYSAVPKERAAKVTLGQRLFVPERLGSEYQRMALVQLSRTTGQLEGPLNAWTTSEMMVPGLIAYDEQCRPLGFFGPIAPMTVKGGSTMPSALETRIFLRPLAQLDTVITKLTTPKKAAVTPTAPPQKKDNS